MQLSSSKRKVIAVVDRAADLHAAAEHLVTARFAFGGTSPYAPDIVLVNEFVRKEFLEHVLNHAIRFLANSSEITNGSPKSPPSNTSNKSPPIADTLNSLQNNKAWKFSAVTRGDTGAVVELSDATILPPKLSQSIFCTSSITSLEHAIDLIENDSDRFLAAYHFSTPSSGKYLSQFIPADASFVNHIPHRLLLGPAAPSFHTVDVNARYTAHQFSRAAPAFIAPPSYRPFFSGKESGKETTELLAESTAEIKGKKRNESIAIGFFEQGIFIGLGVYGIPLLTCVGATVFFGVRAGWRRWWV
jgi:aldehyde dehydrogenase (NAD+)